MARVVQRDEDQQQVTVEWTAEAWLEQHGLLWDGSTPEQVRSYLMLRRSMTPNEAYEYVEALRGVEAGRHMKWSG